MSRAKKDYKWQIVFLTMNNKKDFNIKSINKPTNTEVGYIFSRLDLGLALESMLLEKSDGILLALSTAFLKPF